MATAQVQQAVAAPAHDDNCVKEEEKNHEIIQETPCAEVADQASHAKVHENGGSCTDKEGKDEKTHATDTDEGDRMAQELHAKLAIQHGPAEAEAKDAKEEGRLGRGAKKTDKAAAKGAIVPVNDDTDDEVAAPEGVKETEKAVVITVDDDTDEEIAAPEGVKKVEKAAVVPVVYKSEKEVIAPAGQAPAAAPVASEKGAGEDMTKGGKEDACEEKAQEE